MQRLGLSGMSQFWMRQAEVAGALGGHGRIDLNQSCARAHRRGNPRSLSKKQRQPLIDEVRGKRCQDSNCLVGKTRGRCCSR